MAKRMSYLSSAIFVALMSNAAFSEQSTEPHKIIGLDKPAEILIDEWGIPHIYAQTLYDAFVAQGYAAARDRLWQMDLWRKRGLGEMAKDFGPAWVENDQAARSVLYRGNMYREWLAYGSDAKRVAQAFVAGVNAFIAETEQDPSKLPLEFTLLGYKPARWQAEDTVRIRHHGLTLNFTGEISRAAAYCLGKDGIAADVLRRETVPAIEAVIPEGLEVCDIPADELKKAYQLATAVPRFTEKNTRLAQLSAKNDATDALANLMLFDAETMASFGSNNWAIAPALTSTGRPILANDPHRAHGAPSLRYISHLNAPGMSVIGAGEPFLPGISIGHNGQIAFGLTRFYMDQEDLYVYKLNPDNPHEYEYRGRWEPMTKIEEIIAVKGEGEKTVENWYTRHGPVLYSNGKDKAYALRAAWLDIGMAPYFGSIDYMRAQNFDQFRGAMNRWGAPGENQVYADADGNIGWIPGGLTPIRPNWDGLLPVPGDGRYEWDGYRDGDELPWEYNPARGYVLTANENNIPTDHPLYQKGIGYEWADPARAQRLHGLFAEHVKAGQKFTLEESERLQSDIVSVPAQRVQKLIAPLQSDDPNTAQALKLLNAWDAAIDKDSAAAALYEVWFTDALRPAITESLPETVRGVTRSELSIQRILEHLEGTMLTPEQRDALLLASLGQGWTLTAAKLGDDPTKWRWGDLHQAVFTHPLSDIVDEATRAKLNVDVGGISGSASTPMAATYNLDNYHLRSGGSFKMVVDVGNWDASRIINTPGASGNADSPHYRDLAPLWAEGKYFPMLYSREAVEKSAQTRIALEPDSK